MQSKKIIYLIIVFIIVSCSSNNEECLKSIKLVHDKQYGPDSKVGDVVEIPCDETLIESKPIPKLEDNFLKNFTYEILKYEYSENLDAQNATLILDVKLNNPTSSKIIGFPMFLMKINGVESYYELYYDAEESCREIAPNSSCNFIYNRTFEIDPNDPTTIDFISVEYYIQ